MRFGREEKEMKVEEEGIIVEDICWLENWRVCFSDPKVEYGTKRDEVIATFLAITERKNCVLKPEYRENVAIAGGILNHPSGEFGLWTPVMATGVVAVEHRLLPDGIKKYVKRQRDMVGRLWNRDVEERAKRFGSRSITIDYREKKFATFVTMSDGATFMLGHLKQRLNASADSLYWGMLQGARGHSPDADDEMRERKFGDFVDYFEDININYKPLILK